MRGIFPAFSTLLWSLPFVFCLLTLVTVITIYCPVLNAVFPSFCEIFLPLVMKHMMAWFFFFFLRWDRNSDFKAQSICLCEGFGTVLPDFQGPAFYVWIIKYFTSFCFWDSWLPVLLCLLCCNTQHIVIIPGLRGSNYWADAVYNDSEAFKRLTDRAV